jgi:hypothetical protein
MIRPYYHSPVTNVKEKAGSSGSGFLVKWLSEGYYSTKTAEFRAVGAGSEGDRGFYGGGAEMRILKDGLKFSSVD